MASVKIVVDRIMAHIFIDGQEVHGVTGYSLSHSAGHRPILNLEIIASEMLVDADECAVEIKNKFKQFKKGEIKQL